MTRLILTRVDSVEVVEVRREPESLNRSVDVRLNVRAAVRHAAGAEAVEATLGGDYLRGQLSAPLRIIPVKGAFLSLLLKSLSRTLCFLIKSPSNFSLTPAW